MARTRLLVSVVVVMSLGCVACGGSSAGRPLSPSEVTTTTRIKDPVGQAALRVMMGFRDVHATVDDDGIELEGPVWPDDPFADEGLREEGMPASLHGAAAVVRTQYPEVTIVIEDGEERTMRITSSDLRWLEHASWAAVPSSVTLLDSVDGPALFIEEGVATDRRSEISDAVGDLIGEEEDREVMSIDGGSIDDVAERLAEVGIVGASAGDNTWYGFPEE